MLQVEGQEFEILPDEVEVRLEARSGLAVAAEGAYVAALDTELTPELVREGLAREFVRRLQELRKQADLDVADRIRLFVSATPESDRGDPDASGDHHGRDAGSGASNGRAARWRHAG